MSDDAIAATKEFNTSLETVQTTLQGVLTRIAAQAAPSLTELANQLNCSRQNLSNKMSRNNFDERELTAIANALGCELEINFVNRETGEKIEL